MDKDGSGEVDLAEFGEWYRGEAAGSLLAAVLSCGHCKAYGRSFDCGGWTDAGYTAWEQDDGRADLASRCSVRQRLCLVCVELPSWLRHVLNCLGHCDTC